MCEVVFEIGSESDLEALAEPEGVALVLSTLEAGQSAACTCAQVLTAAAAVVFPFMPVARCNLLGFQPIQLKLQSAKQHGQTWKRMLVQWGCCSWIQEAAGTSSALVMSQQELVQGQNGQATSSGMLMKTEDSRWAESRRIGLPGVPGQPKG